MAELGWCAGLNFCRHHRPPFMASPSRQSSASESTTSVRPRVEQVTCRCFS
jgi:hypothetical protein